MDPNDGRVISNFVNQVLRNEDLTVYDDGKQTRSFCYVDDLIEGIYRMINSPNEVTGPVNLGNPGEFTMLKLAEEVLGQTRSRSKLVHKEMLKVDPKQRRPDITKAKQLLGWEPKVALQEGLANTIEYYRGPMERV